MEFEVIGGGGWVYEPNFYCAYRFLLGEKGSCPLICVGVNPSTATPKRLDRTLVQVKTTAMSRKENDGWVMLNLYPQRATNPDDLANNNDDELMNRNYMVIDAVFKQVNIACGHVDVWCAWGGLVRKRAYLYDCVKQLGCVGSRYSVNWLSRKETKHGDPHHPLYVCKEAEFSQFDMRNYLRKLK